MMSLTERLRGVVRPAGSGPVRAGGRALGDSESTSPDRVAELLGGEWRQASSHRYVVVDRAYAPGHRHGSMSVADGLPPQGGWPRLPLLGGSTSGGTLLFLDLETTGLAGGAGTYAFLVGCGWFDGGRFLVRQFFLSSFAAEHALLEAVREVAEAAATVVTYNGKSFDLPLIETRYALNRMETPFSAMPHIDMLHPARRLWRGQGDPRGDDTARRAVLPAGGLAPALGCRLSALEQLLLGHEREEDVPGFEIPARYFRYVHSGDAAPIGDVLEHNRLDLLSLALLTARAAQLLDEGATGAATGREAFGLGWLFARAGMMQEARVSFARAADMGPALRAESLRAYAVLSRRLRRHDDAAEAWRRLLELPDCPAGFVREATEALAVHHEHRLRSLLSARSFALKSLKMDASASRRHAAEHRLARLERKLGHAYPAALF